MYLFIQNEHVKLKGLLEFKFLHSSEVIEYLEKNPFVSNYLKQIFHECYYPLNTLKTIEMNQMSITKSERENNIAIANLTRGDNPKPKPKEHKIKYRSLQTRAYIRENITNNRDLIDRWFIELSKVKSYNPCPDNIPNYCYVQKKYYFAKILSLYKSKLSEYKTALKFNLLNLRDYNYLTNSLKFNIYYNKLVM